MENNTSQYNQLESELAALNILRHSSYGHNAPSLEIQNMIANRISEIRNELDTLKNKNS